MGAVKRHRGRGSCHTDGKCELRIQITERVCTCADRRIRGERRR